MNSAPNNPRIIANVSAYVKTMHALQLAQHARKPPSIWLVLAVTCAALSLALQILVIAVHALAQ